MRDTINILIYSIVDVLCKKVIRDMATEEAGVHIHQ